MMRKSSENGLEQTTPSKPTGWSWKESKTRIISCWVAIKQNGILYVATILGELAMVA